MVSEVLLRLSMCWCGQVTETEREDLEESEKVQYWVERLCQTRLEQISSVENDSPEVNAPTECRIAALQLTTSFFVCVFFRFCVCVY